MEGDRAEWEYPFAVAGVNLSFMLGDMLDLRKAEGEPPVTAAGRAFVALLADHSDAFELVRFADCWYFFFQPLLNRPRGRHFGPASGREGGGGPPVPLLADHCAFFALVWNAQNWDYATLVAE